MKQIYKITYHPVNKIYIGKDSVGSYKYFGTPNMEIVNLDFEKLPDHIRKNYTIQKEILWESENCSESDLSLKEVEFIRQYQSNNPSIGYNRWPKFTPKA
ncbi:GIY-YIG nuclease family protein [Paraferrimonas sp. SM1919]|uniref:GIY-YIG nuclease family protein n=1 Tax=Paraferrimonas sp. SM1919 TaxID=2662263 RepID=UPI0013D7B863|nr:GIY-YIG nuclease family protein [Paraferrimonas sp. SM1919]